MNDRFTINDGKGIVNTVCLKWAIERLTGLEAGSSKTAGCFWMDPEEDKCALWFDCKDKQEDLHEVECSPTG